MLWTRGMLGVSRCEDLACWQLAHELQQLIHAETAAGAASKDGKFYDQIREQSALATRLIETGFSEYEPQHFAEQLRLVRTSLIAVHNSAAIGLMRGYFPHATVGRIQQLCGRSNTAAQQLIRGLKKPQAAGTIYPSGRIYP